MKSITGVIESVELKKQGNTNGKAWSIFEMFVSGTKMSTFDAEYQNHIGETATIHYEEKQNGNFVNLTAKEFGWKPSAKDQAFANLEERVARLEVQMGNVLGKAEAPVNEAPAVKESSPASVSGPDEISMEDIPF